MSKMRQLAENRLRKVTCPTCGAAVGVACRVGEDKNDSHRYSCAARKLRADIEFPAAVRGLVQVKRKPRRENETHACYGGKHEKCRGVVKKNHGVQSKCTCQCHSKEEGLRN